MTVLPRACSGRSGHGSVADGTELGSSLRARREALHPRTWRHPRTATTPPRASSPGGCAAVSHLRGLLRQPGAGARATAQPFDAHRHRTEDQPHTLVVLTVAPRKADAEEMELLEVIESTRPGPGSELAQR